MSYAIFTVMYGLPLHNDDDRSEAISELVESGMPGMHTMYSGHAPENPAAFGVKLDRFNECPAFIDLAQLKLVPTPDQLQEYQKLWDSLEPEERELLTPYGVPRVFFLTSTS